MDWIKEEKVHAQAIPSPKKKRDVKNKDLMTYPRHKKVKQVAEHAAIPDRPTGNSKCVNTS